MVTIPPIEVVIWGMVYGIVLPHYLGPLENTHHEMSDLYRDEFQWALGLNMDQLIKPN